MPSPRIEARTSLIVAQDGLRRTRAAHCSTGPLNVTAPPALRVQVTRCSSLQIYVIGPGSLQTGVETFFRAVRGSWTMTSFVEYVKYLIVLCSDGIFQESAMSYLNALDVVIASRSGLYGVAFVVLVELRIRD
jgi:hypothetical protein